MKEIEKAERHNISKRSCERCYSCSEPDECIQPSDTVMEDAYNLPAFRQDDSMHLDFDEYLAFPSQTSGPLAPAGGYTPPDWQIENLPKKPNTSHMHTRGPWNNDLKCSEDRNQWTGGVMEFCNGKPAKTCDSVDHPIGCIDRPCHQEQDRRLVPLEALLIEKTKAPCCVGCWQRMQSDSYQHSEANLHLQLCQCVWQMTQTWLCVWHRQNSRRELR